MEQRKLQTKAFKNTLAETWERWVQTPVRNETRASIREMEIDRGGGGGFVFLLLMLPQQS